MQYQTILLELFKQHPALHQRLRDSRTLLPTLQQSARQLRDRHRYWQDTLRQTQDSPAQLTSAALEIALEELRVSLPAASTPSDPEPLSLDAAMAYLRHHTPPA